MSKSSAKRRPLWTAAILILTVGLLWLFLRGADTESIVRAVAQARLPFVAAAVAATLATYVVRAFRWQVLLASLGPAGFGNCFSTTIIGFMVNFLVPTGRMGEIVRPVLLARREGLSASGAIATIFLERLLDLVTVTLLVGFQLLVGDLPAVDPTAVSRLQAGGALGLAAGLSGLGALYLSARFPETALRWAAWPTRWLPDGPRGKLLAFMTTFVTGLGVLLDGRRLAAALGWSIVHWLNVALGFWLGAHALGVVFDYPDTFLVIGFLTIGVAAPTPGGIGAYHYMGALALTTLFGTDDSAARAVVLVNHAIVFLPITLLGIVLFLRAGLSLKSFEDKEEG